MIIWLFVAVFAFFVNLPHIVQKRLVKKLASQEYREQRKYASLKGGSLKIIGWFNLYPLKKALVSTLWLLGVYASIRGVVLVWITHRKDFVWITAFFLLVALLSARRCWRYIKMPYHCAPIFKKMLTRQQFEELLGNEEFDIVQLQNKRYQKGGGRCWQVKIGRSSRGSFFVAAISRKYTMSQH